MRLLARSPLREDPESFRRWRDITIEMDVTAELVMDLRGPWAERIEAYLGKQLAELLKSQLILGEPTE